MTVLSSKLHFQRKPVQYCLNGGGSIMLWRCFSESGPQTAQRVHLPLDSDLKHTARKCKSALRRTLWMSQSWGHSVKHPVNPIKHLWRYLKIAVHKWPPSNLTELEMVCREDWQKFTKSRYTELVASYPTRHHAVIAAKGASTKNWVKVIMNNFANLILLCFHYGFWCLDLKQFTIKVRSHLLLFWEFSRWNSDILYGAPEKTCSEKIFISWPQIPPIHSHNLLIRQHNLLIHLLVLS